MHKPTGMGYHFREIYSARDRSRVAWVFSDDDWDADAAELISAAPEVLDACRNAVRALNTAECFKVGDTDSYEIAAQCLRAIAKAVGEEA
jgi:hypothetical protein